MNLTETEQLRQLAAIFALEDGHKADLTGLDPGTFDAGERRLAVQRIISGCDPVQMRGDLSPDLMRAIFLAAPDAEAEGPGGSTWADLESVIGPIRWEWSDWLPCGLLTMLVGEQGMGKSLLCLRVAGSFLLGWPWPDGSPFTGQRGSIVWCEAESSQGMNLERAKLWGLPTDLIRSPLENPLDDVLLQDADHLQAIENAASLYSVRMVVVDSLSGANVGRENDAMMMHTVKSLAEISKFTNKPLKLTHHLRKRGLLDTGEGITLDRVRGSGTITQPARVVWAIDKPNPQEEAFRISQLKNNPKGKKASPVGFTISDSGLTFGKSPEAPHHETLQDRAEDLLKTILSRAPMKASDIMREFEGAGISYDAAKRAKDRLGIISIRQAKAWLWTLPVRGE